MPRSYELQLKSCLTAAMTFSALSICLARCERVKTENDTKRQSAEMAAGTQRFIDQLNSASTQSDLLDAIDHVRRNGSDEQIRQIAEALVDRLTETSRLKLKFLPEHEKAFPFRSSVGPREISHDRHDVWETHFTIQDIEYVGGRSAWALEQLFGLYLPAFQRSYAKESILARQKIVRRDLFENWPRHLDVAKVRRLPKDRKLELARFYPNPRIPLLLAQDRDIDVQIALVTNMWTPSSIYHLVRRRLSNMRSLSAKQKEMINWYITGNSDGSYTNREIQYLHMLYRCQDDRRLQQPDVQSSLALPNNSAWRSELTTTKNRYVAAIESAKTYDQLHASIQDVRSRISDRQVRDLALALITRITDRRRLELDVNKRGEHAFPFVSTVIANSQIDLRVASVIVINPIHYLVGSATFQDIGFVGGRAAWALEQLFGQYLPPIQLSYSPAEIENRQAGIYHIVIENDWDRRIQMARISQLTVDDRIAIAWRNPNPHVQLLLANDPSDDVRQFVAANRHIAGNGKWTAFLNTRTYDNNVISQYRRRYFNSVRRFPRSPESGFGDSYRWLGPTITQ